LSFLSSDLLEGRNTPSRGLAIAAEYIASEFRGIGLEPIVDGSYFQTARMALVKPDMTGFSLSLSDGQHDLELEATDVTLSAARAIDLTKAPVFKIDPSDSTSIESLTAEELAGKALLVGPLGRANQSARVLFQKISGAKPAVVIYINERAPRQVRERLTLPGE